jgi:hypothetical protein
MASGIGAAILSLAMLTGAAQAETRTFAYGQPGAAKYDGLSTQHQRQTVNRVVKTDRAAFTISPTARKRDLGPKFFQGRRLSR